MSYRNKWCKIISFPCSLMEKSLNTSLKQCKHMKRLKYSSRVVNFDPIILYSSHLYKTVINMLISDTNFKNNFENNR